VVAPGVWLPAPSIADESHTQTQEVTCTEDADEDEFEAPEVSYIDKDGDVVRFTCEEGYLTMYVNNVKCAGEADSVGIVTHLWYRPGQPADIRTQFGFGSSDFPWYVVKKLKEMALGIGVENNLPEEPEASYADKEGDTVSYALEDNHLIMYVNGQRCAGNGDTSGVVTHLIFRPGCPADVRTQHGYGNDDFPWLLVMLLKEMADSIGIVHNLPEAPTRTPNHHSHNLKLARRNKVCGICGEKDTMFSCCLECDFDVCLRCYETHAIETEAACTSASDTKAIEALFVRNGVPDVQVTQPPNEDMEALTKMLEMATSRCVSVLQEEQQDEPIYQ
jgi:hypothetical protein